MGNDLYNMMEMLKYRGRVFKMYEGTIIASGNNHGVNEIDCLPFKEATFFIFCTDHQGAGGKSVTVTIETRHPDPDIQAYETLVAFSAITGATGSERKTVSANLGSVLSLKWVAHGDTTSFTFTVFAVLKIM